MHDYAVGIRFSSLIQYLKKNFNIEQQQKWLNKLFFIGSCCNTLDMMQFNINKKELWCYIFYIVLALGQLLVNLINWVEENINRKKEEVGKSNGKQAANDKQITQST